MGFLSGGDVEVRVSRRALVVAGVALASATAFAVGLRWAVAPAAAPAPAGQTFVSVPNTPAKVLV